METLDDSLDKILPETTMMDCMDKEIDAKNLAFILKGLFNRLAQLLYSKCTLSSSVRSSTLHYRHDEMMFTKKKSIFMGDISVVYKDKRCCDFF